MPAKPVRFWDKHRLICVGKTLHKDESQHKFTYVAYYGVESARKLAQKLVQEAEAELDFLVGKTENLHLIAQYIIKRNH